MFQVDNISFSIMFKSLKCIPNTDEEHQNPFWFAGKVYVLYQK